MVGDSTQSEEVRWLLSHMKAFRMLGVDENALIQPGVGDLRFQFLELEVRIIRSEEENRKPLSTLNEGKTADVNLTKKLKEETSMIAAILRECRAVQGEL